MQNIFQIDGHYFDVIIPEKGIKRKFEVADSDKAGRVLTGKMVRDVIGTYYNYTVELKTHRLSPQQYDDLWYILSAPKESHIITLPYGYDETITFEAYCTSGEDTLIMQRNGKNKWDDLSINFIAMEPRRKPR